MILIDFFTLYYNILNFNFNNFDIYFNEYIFIKKSLLI